VALEVTLHFNGTLQIDFFTLHYITLHQRTCWQADVSIFSSSQLATTALANPSIDGWAYNNTGRSADMIYIGRNLYNTENSMIQQYELQNAHMLNFTQIRMHPLHWCDINWNDKPTAITQPNALTNTIPPEGGNNSKKW